MIELEYRTIFGDNDQNHLDTEIYLEVYSKF